MEETAYASYAELTEIRELITALNDGFQGVVGVEALLSDSNGESLGVVKQLANEGYVFYPNG